MRAACGVVLGCREPACWKQAEIQLLDRGAFSLGRPCGRR